MELIQCNSIEMRLNKLYQVTSIVFYWRQLDEINCWINLSIKEEILRYTGPLLDLPYDI